MGQSAGKGIIHVHVEDGPDQRSANRRRLTPAQYVVMRMRATGMTNAEVARDLDVSVSTVKNHTSDAYRRVGTTDIVSFMNIMGWVRVR